MCIGTHDGTAFRRGYSRRINRGARPPSERQMTVRQQIVDQFCNGIVQAAHQLWEVLADSQVAESVVVIITQSRDPGRESKLSCSN